MRANEIITENLRKWFKEKWVRFGPDGKIRGACARGDDSEGKPKCLPQAKAHSLGKKGRKYAASKKRREDPNPERRGPAKNVATKKKTSEGLGDTKTDILGTYKGYKFAIETQAEDDRIVKFYSAISPDGKEHSLPKGTTAEQFKKFVDSKQGVAEAAGDLSLQQLATISDEALDKAYGYGRSTPGNSFGWQANLKSAAYAKQMIDKGVTDIEAISDAIHKGWNVTAQSFVKNPDQFSDTEKLKAAGKLEAKLQQRAQLMKQNYAQLPEEEKEKDRVVARALLQAIKGQQGVAEGSPRKPLDNKQGRAAIGDWERVMAEPESPEHQAATKQRIKTKPMAGPKSPLPEEGVTEEKCPHCGGAMFSELMINEKKDACYYKVKSRYKVWPSAYASGALVKCRKKGASNWGTGGKKNESVSEEFHTGGSKGLPMPGTYEQETDKFMRHGQRRIMAMTNEEQLDEKWSEKYKRSINCSNPKGFSQKAHCQGRKKK